MAKDISKLKDKGKEIIIVSSGAVGCGKNIIKGNRKLSVRQAQASIGQILLIQKYHKYFKKFNLNVSQFLLTSREIKEKRSLDNLKNTYTQIKDHAIAIVNENDVISTEELTFGDNDNLAKELMIALNFDTLIILTEKGQLIKNGKRLTETNLYEIEDYDKLKIKGTGFGGLKSKLYCAKFLILNNKKVFIGKYSDNIIKIITNINKRTKFVK